MMRLWWRLVRFGFRLLYNEMAFTYDWVSWIVSLGQWRCWQRGALQFLPDAQSGTILEVAHGTGNLQLDLRAAGYRSVAMDLSPYMGRIAHQKLAKYQLQSDFVRGSAFELPFASQAFVALVCTFPTDFVVQPQVLSEFRRVLVDGGQVIIVLSGVFTQGGVVQAFLESLYRITGQRQQNREQYITQAFEGYALSVEAVEVLCKGSTAQLVILTKN
jgi:ubiquinone/menaquinone biosynthesis C-methylase UbiE